MAYQTYKLNCIYKIPSSRDTVVALLIEC